MSVLTPEGHLPLCDAVSELAQQIGGEVMRQDKPAILVELERATNAAMKRSAAAPIRTNGPNIRPPTAAELAAFDAALAKTRAEWAPVAERQRRAWDEARRRLRLELAEGRLSAVAVAGNGSLRPVASAPWRAAGGERAMAIGRLDAPAFGVFPDWPIFLPEDAFRKWMKPPARDRASDNVLRPLVAGMAEKIACETGRKPTQAMIEAALLAADFTEAEARRGSKMIPPHLALGRGDHDRAPLSRVAAKKSP